MDKVLFPKSRHVARGSAVTPRPFHHVIPDLRGYGDSKGPEPDHAHVRYSKRAMVEDMVKIMTVTR